jgi:hypothetical protein
MALDIAAALALLNTTTEPMGDKRREDQGTSVLIADACGKEIGAKCFGWDREPTPIHVACEDRVS